MNERIYTVRDARANPAKERLVRAANRAQALRHAAEASFSVEVASQNELVFLLGQGVAVEDAGTSRVLQDAADAADSVPNAETRQAIADADSGNTIGPFANAREAFAELTDDKAA